MVLMTVNFGILVVYISIRHPNFSKHKLLGFNSCKTISYLGHTDTVEGKVGNCSDRIPSISY
jgi:hypothetical protein